MIKIHHVLWNIKGKYINIFSISLKLLHNLSPACIMPIQGLMIPTSQRVGMSARSFGGFRTSPPGRFCQMQNQAGSREQVTKLMQESTQEAQSYFMSQNRKLEHKEMMSKVKELLVQKMNAQGISRDVQQKVLSDMDQKAPPQQPQQRQ